MLIPVISTQLPVMIKHVHAHNILLDPYCIIDVFVSVYILMQIFLHCLLSFAISLEDLLVDLHSTFIQLHSN